MEQMEAPVPNISPTKEEEIKGLKDFNIKADEENYVLKLGKLNDSKKIVFIIEQQINLTNYYYKSEFSLSELKSINKLFIKFDSIDEAYNEFSEILNNNKIKIQKDIKEINLHISLTNLSSKTEDICLRIKKENVNNENINEMILKELSNLKRLFKEEQKEKENLRKKLDEFIKENNKIKSQVEELIKWKNSIEENLKGEKQEEDNNDNSNFRILMLGLDEGGKTTILYQLKIGEVVKTIPTIGFNAESFEYKGLNLTLWDFGGIDKIRVLWKHYYKDTNVIIFVVDSNDKHRIDEATRELKNVLNEEELIDCPILVLANKQDLRSSVSHEEITEKLGMKQLKGRCGQFKVHQL